MRLGQALKSIKFDQPEWTWLKYQINAMLYESICGIIIHVINSPYNLSLKR